MARLEKPQHRLLETYSPPYIPMQPELGPCLGLENLMSFLEYTSQAVEAISDNHRILLRHRHKLSLSSLQPLDQIID